MSDQFDRSILAPNLEPERIAIDISEGRCPEGHGPLDDGWCPTCEGTYSLEKYGDGSTEPVLNLGEFPVVSREKRRQKAAVLAEVLRCKAMRTTQQDEVLGVLEQSITRGDR